MAQLHTQSRGSAHAFAHGTSDHEDLPATPQSGFAKWRAGTIANLLVGAGPMRSALNRANWALQDTYGSLAVLVRRERDSGSMFGFAPVALGAGIALYFVAPGEPIFAIVFSSFLFAATMAARMKVHGVIYLAAVASALIFFGMTVAQIRTKLSGGPIIARQLTAAINGIVIERDLNSRGKPRYLIKPGSIEGLTVEQLPKLIRLSASSAHTLFEPGQPISGIARISAFSGPAYRGGFDFGFSNWFEGLGGTGFFLGAPREVTEAMPARISLRSKIKIAINSMRLAIGARIRRQLDGESGAIAVAIIIGDRTGISGPTQASLRRSGLAHILAISGLHMALVTLTVIWTLRLSFSLSPQIALHYPIHKWAALGGLIASTLYLVLSGGAVATQRSWIMLAIMLGARLIDRRALTIRNVALAAIIVLVIAPESLIEPGFQMSFAAAGSLVAAYSGISNWRMAHREQLRVPGNIAAKALGYFAGLAFTSVVAGLATGLFAAWHFHRIAPLGLVANLLAMPVVSVLVMPLALLSTLLMPYGIESIALRPLQWSIEVVIAISAWVNGIPAPSVTGIQPISVLLTGVLGILLLNLLRTRLRFAGIVPITAMFFLARTEMPPDLIISQDGRAIGIRNSANELALAYPRRNRFVTDIWLRAWSRGKKGKLDDPAGPCDKDHCILATPSGIRVELVYAPEKIPSACENADILIAPRLWWVNCSGQRVANSLAHNGTRTPAIILKRLDFEKSGTHQLRFEELQAAASSRSSGPCPAQSPGFRKLSPDGRNELLLANWHNKCWRVSIEKSLANDDRPWNAARIALAEPVFDRRRKASGNGIGPVAPDFAGREFNNGGSIRPDGPAP